MIINGDLTLYMRIYNPTTRSYGYKRKVLVGVYFEKSAGLDSASTGNTRSDKAFVIIHKKNHNQGYQSDKDFRANPTGWTLRTEDALVLGVVLDEVDSIKDLEEKYDDVYSITRVDEHTAGTPGVHHWEVWAK